MRGRKWAFLTALALAAVATWAQGQQQQDAGTTPAKLGFWPVGGTDGTSSRAWRLDANGFGNVVDRTRDDWQSILNIRNNSPVSDQFESAVLDMDKLGGQPILLLKAPGESNLYVALDGMYASTADSNSVFRFRLGTSKPAQSAAQAAGTFLTVAGSISQDSTVTTASHMIPLVDTLTGAWFAAPFARLHIWSAGQVVGVYAHMIGRP